MYYKVALLRKIQGHLQQGGVIAYPTESCYGLGCDTRNHRAINKILKLKKRNKKKGLIVIASKVKQLNRIIKPLGLDEIATTKKYWPGHYSLIIDANKNIQSNLIGHHNQIAVRITKHNNVRQICNFLNMPLVSTSANKAGFKSIKNYKTCQKLFGKKVLVLPSHTNNASHPSTIINLKNNIKLR